MFCGAGIILIFLLQPGTTDLLQVPHHVVLVGPEYAAEEFDDLLVVEVVDALDDARQEQLHRQVQVSVELI